MSAQLAIRNNTTPANELSKILNFQAPQVDLATLSIQTSSPPTSPAVVNHESSTVVSPFHDTPSSLPNMLHAMDIIGRPSIRNRLKPSDQKCLHNPDRHWRRRCPPCVCENPCTCRDSCVCKNTCRCRRRKIRY